MSHTEICPICGGSGKIEQPECTAPVRPCHGCSGRGWVEIWQVEHPLAWPELTRQLLEDLQAICRVGGHT